MHTMTDDPSGHPDDEDASSWSDALPVAVSALADRLVPVFYEELKRVARHERYRVGAGVTMQTTALVNEAYLKLRSAKGWNDDAHFLRAAALAMRHALVNHAEAHRAAKRGSGAVHLSLTAAENVALDTDETLITINEAIQRLSEQSPRLAQVVECRYFGGFDDESTARALNLSKRTVRRDWALARAWLHRELAQPRAPEPVA
jgi:RNA polymerase sigma factor (TIGR02999 family)